MAHNFYTKFLLAALAFCTFAGVYAQSPGGVTPAAWYRAGSAVFSDAGTTPAADNATVQQWNSQVGSFPLLQATSGWRPTFSNATTLANFNPTMTFPGGQFMQFTPGVGVNMIDRATGSIFAAGFMNTVTGCGLAGFDESMDFPGLHTSTNNPRELLFFTSGGPGYQGISSNTFIAGRYFTIGSGWENTATPGTYLGATVSLDGERTTYLPTDNKIYNVNVTNDGYRDFRIGWDSNWGAFNGQLNEVMVYEDRLSESQMDRVETYMAIKYGTTYAAGARNYVNSAGSPVWTVATNPGYNKNIAGIARDNAGALHQKQSWSTNPGRQVLIGTTGLANTNADNATGLSDGQFLLWGDNGLAKSPSVSVSGLSGITHHFAAIWKVENTGVSTVRVAWPKGLTNLSLIRSSDATIGAGDDVSLMAGNEVSVNGVVYNYADVTLANGTYFTFGGSLYMPGGIVPAAWYRADSKVYSDAGVTPAADATGVAQWNEYNGFGFDLKQATQANRPVFSNSATLSNFNPTVTFTGASGTRLDYLVADNGEIIARNTGTLFSAGKTTTSAGLFGFGANMDYPGLYITGNDDLTFLGNFGGNWATDLATPPNAQGNFIGGGGWFNGASTLPAHRNLIATSYNGRYFSHDLLDTWDTNIGASDGNLSVGHDPNFAHLTGQENEMIVFDTKLTDAEMNKVESYLAIKWGQTLSKASSRNYVGAGGNIIWDGTANQTHYHNVFGLGRQDVAAFDQRVAKSVNTDAIMTVAADNDFALPNHDGSRRDFAGNETYFLLGDNNDVTTTLADITAGSLELKRIPKDWHSQRTGSAGTLHFSTDLSAYGANFSGSNPVYMIIADDAAFTTNVRTVSATLEGGEWVSSYGFDGQAANQYITYGFTPPTCSAGNGIAPGGVSNGLAYWYRADMNATNTGNGSDVTAWQDAWSHTTSAQIASSALPKFKTGAVDYFNFNAGVNFTAGNQVIGNTTVQTLFNTDFDIFTFTKNEVNGRFFNVGVNNTLTGGNNWDQPAFMGNGDIARRANAAGSYGSIGYVNPGGGHSGIAYHKFSDLALTKGMNGAATATPITHSARGQMEGGHLFGANNIAPWNGDDGGFVGHIGETIVYGCGNLTDIQRRRVDSYLAIKYGFTLDRTETDDYLAADASIVWDGETNTAFNNNIFGVAREDIGAFHQKASKSVNSGTIMTIATTSDFVNPNNDAARRDFDNDKTYFILGDNANTATPTVAVAGIAGLERIQRVWLSQRTDDAGDLHFSTDLLGYGTNFGGSMFVYMIIADDAAFTTNVRTVPATLVGGQWVSDYDFDARLNNQYITYGYSEVALPVSLLHFNGYQEGSAVTLNWATVSEKNNAGFDVERSTEGRNWTRLGFVAGKSKTGESSVKLDYNFTDALPLAGKNYYRLKQIDLTGSYEYSRMVLVDIRPGKNSLLVYPNPVAGGKLTLKLDGLDIQSVGVFSITGTQMRVGRLQRDNTLELGNLPAGQYFVRITGRNGDVITKSFIVP